MPRPEVVHDGLLEVLDPARRTVRMQKELSEATRMAAPHREGRAPRSVTAAPSSAARPTSARRRICPTVVGERPPQ